MHRKLVIASLSLVLTGSLAAQERLQTKQLAGPIDEIRTGVMAQVAPIETAIHSKSAMIPVELSPDKDGMWSWSRSLPVDGADLKMVLFAGEESWNLSLGQPGEHAAAPAHKMALEVKRTALEMGSNSFEGDHYRFAELEPGQWKVSVETEAPLARQGYLLYSSDSPYRLLSYKATTEQLVGRSISFVSHGFEKVAEGFGSRDNNGMVEEAWMQVTMPGGVERTFPMFDAGRHDDQLAGDGIFGGSFIPKAAGSYSVQVIARGTTPEGHPFLRTAQHLVPVVTPAMELAHDFAPATLVDDERLEVSLAVDTFEGSPEMYRVFAEVWGADAAGAMRPVSWIGGMSYVDQGRLSLGLDLRWIGLSGAVRDFELRNVRIEDPDHFIPVARVERMEVATPTLPAIARMAPKSIDEEMLMGPRPEPKSFEKAGSRLLLVHGYCSGNVWGSQTHQFTNESVFLDLDKNRSHNDFAIRVGNFGAAWDSFGIVAHSQGGAAGLHLYTYYWSGLDFASGGRLIQSVGTPYQGTALAGNAAVLGQIFGAGCGSNTDLTYSGASAWLSGVPSWARNAVNYYTTAFKDNWWSYDYCHLVTDLLLGDPDDGTTEKSKGQLSSGVNRGHKSGWCHTSGMAEPPQTTDGSRNSSMNSNAAN